MKHLFIINPHAGKYDRSHEIREKVARVMEGRGKDYEILVTQYAGHGREEVRRAAELGEPLRVYACGGDGTLNECVVGAAGAPNAAVTHYPTGSGNDFIRMFGPDTCRFHDLEALLDAPQESLDLIDCNGHLALNVCSVGFDARIGLGAADFKKLPLVSGTMAYQLSALRTILQGIHRPYRVELDGEVLAHKEFTLLCACNGRYYGGGFMPVGDAMPDDGVLDMLVVPRVNRRTFARLVGQYAQGRYRDYPELIYACQGQTISFSSSQELVAVVDGEVLRGRRFTVALSERKVAFFYPAGLSYQPKD